MAALEQLAQPQQNTYSFDGEKELLELKMAVKGASKEDKKRDWWKNADKDLKALSKEIPFIRAEKTYNNWVAQSKNTHQVNSTVSKEFKTPHQTRSTKLVPVSVGTINSSSAEFAKYIPYVAKEPEELDRRVEVGDEIVHLEYPLYGQHIFEPVHLVDGQVIHDDTLPRWPIFEAPTNLKGNEVAPKIDQLAQQVSENSITGSKRGKRGWFNNLKRTGASIALALAILGCNNPFDRPGPGPESTPTAVSTPTTPTPTGTPEPATEDQRFTKIRFPDPDLNMKAELEAQGKFHFDGYLASVRGQMVKASVEDYRTKAAEQGVEYSADDWVAYQQILEADPSMAEKINQGIGVFQADHNGLKIYTNIDNNENTELLMTRTDPGAGISRSEGQVYEFKWRKNMADYFGSGYAIQPPVAEPTAVPTPEPTPAPTAEPTAEPGPAVPHLGPNFNAEHPRSFVCPDINSESKFLAQSKVGCLNESLRKINFNVNSLNESNLYRGDTTEQDLVKAAAKFGIPVETLRVALPLDRQGAMYVAFVNEKGQKTIGSIFFNFTNTNRFDLMSPNKTLPRTAKLTYVYQDGKVVLVLDMCGNLIPGQEIPKAAPSPTPTPAQVALSPTPTETPRAVVTPTPSQTPRPTPPISYPSPEATASSTPVPTSTTVIYGPPPPPQVRVAPAAALKMIDNFPINNCTGPEDVPGNGFPIEFNVNGIVRVAYTGSNGIAEAPGFNGQTGFWQVGTPYTGHERTDLMSAGFILESEQTQGFVGTNNIVRICDRFEIPAIPPTATGIPTATNTPEVFVSPTRAPFESPTTVPPTSTVVEVTPTKSATVFVSPTRAPFESPTTIPATSTPKAITATATKSATATTKIFVSPTRAGFELPTTVPATSTPRPVTPTRATTR